MKSSPQKDRHKSSSFARYVRPFLFPSASGPCKQLASSSIPNAQKGKPRSLHTVPHSPQTPTVAMARNGPRLASASASCARQELASHTEQCHDGLFTNSKQSQHRACKCPAEQVCPWMNAEDMQTLESHISHCSREGA
eukprot:scaffold264515_cov31-Tisochrysis_lutea.AAC.4